MGLLLTQEERFEQIRSMNLLNDKFMSVVLRDKPACQHVLQVLTGINDLIVMDVRTQYTISKAVSHDSRLDVLAEDSKHQLYNIEIQRFDTVDHALRARFQTSMIDSEVLDKGKTYDKLPTVYIFYISEKDIWKKGKTVLRVEKSLDGDVYDDRQHTIYVNAAVNDGTEIAKLMQYFKTANPTDSTQGDLSKRVQHLKSEEGRDEVMIENMDDFTYTGMMIATTKNVLALMKKQHLTLEQAMEVLDVPNEQKPDIERVMEYLAGQKSA